MSKNNLTYINKSNDNKLNTNDLIKLGLYSLLVILLMAVGVGVCALIFSVIFSGKIYFSIFTTVGTGFFAAPAFTLIFHKINKKYSVFIVTIIVGLFLLLSGHLAVAFPFSLVGAVIAEYFFRKNNEYLSYIFFTLSGIGAIIPMYFMRAQYVAHLQARDFSASKIDFIMANSSMTMFYYIIILTIIFSIIGTYFGRKIYFKNFNKAGL